MEVALQEAVDVIGVSILSGSHVSIAKKLMKRLKERELEDVLVLFGGTIPKDDIAVLKEQGVKGVFPSHAKLEEISTFIRENVKEAPGTRAVGGMKSTGVPKTFVENILGAPEGAIVFRKPDIVLTHDNTASIEETFEQMGGERVFDPDRLLVVLDHNAPPTNAKLATDYRNIRSFVKAQGVTRFYDVGKGICHQLMAGHARPGMIIAGSDSHSCTAGAFNTLAVGIDRTEAAGLYKRGETWFRVPRSMKITLKGALPPGVYAKDLALWIIGKIGVAGANYLSVEFHGEGVKTLSVSERMTLANMGSEMGAKNVAFPADDILARYLGAAMKPGVWADPGAAYAAELAIDLDELFPVAAAPHSVENIKAVAEIEGTKIDAALIGTCTNGRLDDLRVAAELLAGKEVAEGVQLLVIPASQEIYLQALDEGLVTRLIRAGATVLAASCGPCLGAGQGIPADGHTVISTANRNFLGRMGNPKAASLPGVPRDRGDVGPEGPDHRSPRGEARRRV